MFSSPYNTVIAHTAKESNYSDTKIILLSSWRKVIPQFSSKFKNVYGFLKPNANKIKKGENINKLPRLNGSKKTTETVKCKEEFIMFVNSKNEKKVRL